MAAIKNAVTACPGNARTLPEKYSTMILNTGGWISSEQDDAFGNEGIPSLYGFYRGPLKKKGFLRSIQTLTEQWQSLCDYSIKFLAPGLV